MEDSSLYQNYNTDDIFNRSVIGGLLYLLNNKLKYKQVWDDNTVEEVTVPFVYNLSNNKQNQDFLQDNYTFFGRECFSDKLIDGKFDMFPRFAINYAGSQINSSEITHRFVKVTFVKNEGGNIVSYTAFMYILPLSMTIDVEGWVDNIDTAFKLEQEIRETFFKNQTFNVLYKGVKIPCCVGFPEQITQDKTVSYSFEQDAQMKMNFTLAVECYQPCFDESTIIPSDKKIEHIGFDINHYNENLSIKTKRVDIKLDPIDTSSPYSTGDVLTISWKTKSDMSSVSTVFLYYITEDGDKHFIGLPMMSSDSYDWVIPNSISKYAQPYIVFIDGDIECVEQPIVSVVPDSSGFITTGGFYISKPGKFTDDGYVQVSCEYVDSNGILNIHDCYVANVTKDGVQDILYLDDVPEQNFIITNTNRMKYTKGGFISNISIGISYPMDSSIFDQIDNILII